MKLPNDSIGVSDLLAWRDCPTRMELGMQRHEGNEDPGSQNLNNAYGSCIHDCIHLVAEQGMTNADAITQVWSKYARHLDPEDLALLEEDLDKYRGDVPLGFELIGTEMECRVPLFIVDGVQIYFRFRLDALYRRVGDHTVFLMRDYKSSKWRKTQEEVDGDVQMWAYAWGIREMYPECRSLIQSYEQLRFGNLTPSPKSDTQLRQMKRWLIETTKAVMADEDMAPTQNQWCPWCPLLLTCSETKRANAVAKAKMIALAPLTKEGRKTRIKFADEGADLEEMLEVELPKAIETRKHLEKFEEAAKEVIERMPSAERDRLGWHLSERRTKSLSPSALRELAGMMGDSFFEAVSLSRTALDKVAGTAELQFADENSLESVTSTGIRQRSGRT